MGENFEFNKKRYIQYGIFYELMIICVNPYAIKFLTRIGGTNFDISLYNAMKGIFMVLVVLPGVFFIDQFENKKKITSILIFFIALMSFSFVFVPIVPAGIKPLVFIFLSAAMMIPISLYTPCFQSFTGALFPLRRSEVIAGRNMLTVVFVTAMTLSSGFVFKIFAKTDKDYIFIYQSLFVIAFIFGIISVLFFNSIRYKNTQKHDKIDLKYIIKTTRENKGFRNFITASTLFHFGWCMGWPLFSIYMVDTLKADELWLAVISVGSSVFMVLGQKKWPEYIERYGLERISTICTLGMAITPILYAISPSLPVLAVVGSVSGIFISGTTTVLLADLLEVAPEKNRIVFVGFYNTFINLMLAISPFIGHFFLSTFNIYVALIITAAFRTLGSFAFLIREKKNGI